MVSTVSCGSDEENGIVVEKWRKMAAAWRKFLGRCGGCGVW